MKTTSVAFTEKDFYKEKNLDIRLVKPENKFENDNEFLDYLVLNGFEKQLEFKLNQDDDLWVEGFENFKEVWVHDSNKIAVGLLFKQKIGKKKQLNDIICHFHESAPKSTFDHNTVTYVNEVGGKIVVLNPTSSNAFRVDSLAVKEKKLGFSFSGKDISASLQPRPMPSIDFGFDFHEHTLVFSDPNLFFPTVSKFLKHYKMNMLSLPQWGVPKWLNDSSSYTLTEVKPGSYAENFIYKDNSDRSHYLRHSEQMDRLGDFLSALNLHFTQQYFWNDKDHANLKDYNQALKLEYWDENKMFLPAHERVKGTRGMFEMAVLSTIVAPPLNRGIQDVDCVLNFLKGLSTEQINGLCRFDEDEKYYSFPSMLMLSCLTLTPTLSSVENALPVVEEIFNILDEKRTVPMEWGKDLYKAIIYFAETESSNVFAPYKDKIENFLLGMNKKYPDILKIPEREVYHHYNFKNKMPFEVIDKQVMEFELNSCSEFEQYIDQAFGLLKGSKNVKSGLSKLWLSQVLEREIQQSVKPALKSNEKKVQNFRF